MGYAAANNDRNALVAIICAGCGCRFGITADMKERRRADGQNFHCPNGHLNHWGDNEHARTKKELDEARANETRLRTKLVEREQDIVRAKERAKHEERRARSARGHATRLRKRIAAGQCPCCSEQFANVAKHIADKHPKYVPAEEE